MENKIPQLPNEEHYCKCGHMRKKHKGGSDPKSGRSEDKTSCITVASKSSGVADGKQGT